MNTRVSKTVSLVAMVVAVLTTLVPLPAAAAPLAQEPSCAQEVTIQADDWLSKIADKYLGDPMVYPAIVVATNQVHETDDTFAQITNPDLIEIGWKLCVPGAAEAAPAATEVQPLTDEALAEFEAYIEATRELYNVPGMAVVVVQGGEVVYAQGFGVKEIGGDDPITPDTVFSIGSLGKAMTSIMVASLVDEGLIGWDTPGDFLLMPFQFVEGEDGGITLVIAGAIEAPKIE